jgi:predicted ArsR family transcriptional regulator
MDVRAKIVEVLRDAEGGLTTKALVRAVGAPANTVRWHLAALADQGLVDSATVRGEGRGRPSLVHRLTPDGLARGRDDYRMLATMLTAALAEGEQGPTHSYDAGVRFGVYLMEAPDPLAKPNEEAAGRRVTSFLDRQGFAARLEGMSVCMRRCPFLALAESSSEIICALHRGVLDGALAEAGSKLRVSRLEPFVEPGLCVARLAAKPSS